MGLRLALLGPLVLPLSGCERLFQRTSGPRAAKEDQALSPKESDILFMVNLARARKSALWQKFRAFQDKDPASKKQYEDFVKKCQFDPLTQIDSLFLAVPRNATETREFALFLRGTFAGQNLVNCLRQSAKEDGKDVIEGDHQGQKIYTNPSQEGGFTLLDNKIAVLGGKTWLRKVIDLHQGRAQGQGAKDNTEVANLVRRVRVGDAIWGVGLIPEKITERLSKQPELGAAASMQSALGSLDFDKGVKLTLTLDLPSKEKAAELTTKVSEQLAAGRKDPKIQLMGLAGYFDAIKVSAAERSFMVQVDLNQGQVDDLAARLSGLLQTLGGGFKASP